MDPQQRNNYSGSLDKERLEAHFKRIFEDDSNTLCFECGNRSKQWVETNYSIFLCLTCAAQYKEFQGQVFVKSVSLDLFSLAEMKNLERGGNKRLKNFFDNYDLMRYDFKHRLKTKAAFYYRVMLQSEALGHTIEEPPAPEEGKQIAKEHLSITQMSPGEILSSAKTTVKAFGSKTFQLGSRAMTKVQEKVRNTQFKEGAKNAAGKISSTAASLWGSLKSTIHDLRSKEEAPDKK